MIGPEPPARSEPETSIVIRTFNESRHLPPLLRRLGDQSYQDFEVIVVDSGSVDGTREAARDLGARVVRIDRSDFTFGYSLNAGIEKARGRLIVIVSAHTLPATDLWLAALLAALRSPRVAMVYGKQLGWPTSKFSEVQDFRRTFGDSRLTLQPPRFFANNANSAIRRDLWQEYRFDVELPGLEDIDWARHWMETGQLVIYEPAAAVHHIHEERAAQIRHRYYREAVAARRLRMKRRRSVVTEVGREAARAVFDLSIAIGRRVRRELPQKIGPCAAEIVSFRFNKALGTAHGLLDGARLADPQARSRLFFDSSFEAVVIEAPGRAAIRRRPMPDLRPGDVVIKVSYVGVCRTDLEILDGTLGYFARGLAGYPLVPGHEMSGRVVAVGPAVSDLAPGDPVVVECIQSCGACDQCLRNNRTGCPERRELGVFKADGAYARYVIVPRRFVHRLPAETDLSRAALCEPLAVVLKGLGRLQRVWADAPGRRRCAVMGGGSLGRMCGLVLAHWGHEVVLFDADPGRAAVNEPGLVGSTTVASLQDFDALVEATGDPGALDTLLAGGRPGSTLLLLGLPYARRAFDFESLVAYDRTLIGSVGSGPDDFRGAIALLGALKLQPYLENIVPFEQFSLAWDRCRRREGLKTLLRVDPS
jgi:threonine dehydrogenase-like Zn-dependent dehydrogenase/glycosyltransferase involved in cell wall biosynthesis